MLLLNKIDLRPYVPFDQPLFIRDVRRLNSTVPIFELSVQQGLGMEHWLDWVRRSAASKAAS